MSSAKETYNSGRTRNIKMLKAMVAIGSMCALLIVLTYESTFTQIETNKAEALQKAIFTVLPQSTSIVPFKVFGESLEIKKEEDTAFPVVYAGYSQDGMLTGFVIDAQGQGYAGILRILYGYIPSEEKIKGLYVLESKETPGLGDKIEKDASFLANFEGLEASLTDDRNQLKNRIITVKSGEKENPWEIDGITGATISSRAIGEIIGLSAMEYIPILHDASKQNTIHQKPEL